MERKVLVADLAKISLKTNMELTRREFLKTALTIGGVIAVEPIVSACIKITSQVGVPSKETAVVPEPTGIPYPKVEPIYIKDVDVLFKGHEEEYAKLGVAKETVNGGYFDGSFLFHFKDKDGFDYFILNRGSTSEPKNTFQPLDWMQDGTEFALVSKDRETPTSPILKYFVWNPNEENQAGDMLVTYQPDGTSSKSTIYRLPKDNGIAGTMKVHAIMAQIETESPLPEGPISELQKTLGENYKLTKAKEGDYFIVDGIDNLKFNEDGTAELVFEDRDLTVDFKTISVKDEALRVEGLQYKDKLWARITSGAPTEADAGDLEKYIANLPKEVLVLGATNYEEIDRTNRLMDQIVMEKTATYDPLDEFKGIIVDGKEVDVVNLASRAWTTFDPGKDSPMFIQGYGTPYDTMLIALGQGWSNLEIYDASGNKLQEVIHVPIVSMNSDLSITVTNGLINKNKLPEILELLTKERRGSIEPQIIRDVEVSNQTIREQMLSDEGLREFMAKYNKTFLNQEILKEDMAKLPPELSTLMYFDFRLWPK